MFEAKTLILPTAHYELMASFLLIKEKWWANGK